MEALRRIADRLDEAASVLAGARPDEVEPGWDDAPGEPGVVTAALQRQLAAALHGRAREATTAATRLGGLAAELRAAAAGYTAADEAANSQTGRRLEP